MTLTAYDYKQHCMQLSGCRRPRTVFNMLNGAMLQKLITAINSCGVQFRIWKEIDNTGALNWTSLMGPDKLILLRQLHDKLSTCHPHEMISDVQTLWKVSAKLVYKLSFKLCNYMC